MARSPEMDAYWRDRTFLEAARLVASETTLSQEGALSMLQAECERHPLDTPRETLHAAVNRLLERYPKPPAPASMGVLARLWRALTGKD